MPAAGDRRSPLQNRVTPFGDLAAVSARGLFMGNRGGHFHTDARTLTGRRWASQQWICCVLDFKGRHREVWGRFYTELFFLDEPTALAAGHRPCFECRREHAVTFAEKWRDASGLHARPRADEMDDVLHRERLNGRVKRVHRQNIDALPDGAFVALRGGGFCGARQYSPALDIGRLPGRQAAFARRRGRCAHASGNPRGSVCRLPSPLASHCG